MKRFDLWRNTPFSMKANVILLFFAMPFYHRKLMKASNDN